MAPVYGCAFFVQQGFWILPERMHCTQTFLRTTEPFSTTRMDWIFGSKVLGETFTTCIPMPPFFFAKPLRMMVAP